MNTLDGIEETIGPKGYISAASIGSAIGLIGGPAGMLIGGVLGGVIDSFLGAKDKKDQRKAMEKAFYTQLLKRYNTQIFISALERMGPAMVYLQSLGLKPGSREFDAAMKKKLFADIGYRGDCAIDLYGPAASGQKRSLLATIDRGGKLTPHNPHIDHSLGPKWLGACKDFHKEALKAWAREKRDTIVFQRDMEKDRSISRRKSTTRLLVNLGVVFLFFGYMLRQKKKLTFMRTYKKQQKQAKESLSNLVK